MEGLGILARTLRGLLPAEIAGRLDFDSLRFLPEESVGESLRASRTDLIFSVRMTARTSFPSSLSSRATPIPMSPSSFSAMRPPSGPGPPPEPGPRQILPVLFAHGREPWTLSPVLSDLLGRPPFLRPYLPDYTLISIDLDPSPMTTFASGSTTS